ncbi:hypothetical protein CDL12_11877 [Handroanthus impetiginosus]|uniref:Uncharacterized protein n=1 Tax=Handroanthus impetiginosus TaxID=429701 RepID=A0A2G9HD89_9LAMI|nr:hypothetical protein CDL12_11877 [Handroanthus impetiginosus]
MSSGHVVTRRVSLAKCDRLMKLKIEGVLLRMQQPLELPPSLIKFALKNTQLSEDPMKTPKNLPKLKILHLKYVHGFGSKIDCSGTDSFPQLQVLRLNGLFGLEELIEEEVMGMPTLKQVTIDPGL